MHIFVVAVAIVNLGLGFALAVYFGAAPRFAHSRVPLLRAGHSEPPSFIRRVMAFLPKKRASHPAA